MSQVSSTKKLLSASVLMASGTMISRVLGVVRVMLVAFILGNGTRQADMLSIATMVPNALYILLAGGALNTVLVPQIVRAIKNDDDGGEAYTNRIMTAFMLAVSAVAIVVTVAAPIVTSLYTSSAWRAPELADQYASMVALTYLTLPQIFFYGAFFLLGQVLNARDKFGPMMWAPIANNVISILVMGVYLVVWGTGGDHSGAFTTPQILVLGLGSTLGIAMQMVVLLPFVRRVGFKLRPRFDLKGTGLGKTFSLTKWTFGFVAVNQVALMVVNQLATSATATGHGAGSTVYSNAHLLWILPHSLITVSLATAMLPNASRLAASGDTPGVAQEFMKTTRLSLIAIVPATVAFLSLAEPMTALLFGHGSGSQDSGWIAWALMGFAIGLVPYTVQFICLRTFYALENTRTPFMLQLIIAGLNIAAAIAFVWLVNSPSWVAAALATAFSVAYFVGVFFSWQALKKRIPDLNGGRLMLHIVRLMLGAAVGGVAAYFVAGLIIDALGSSIVGDIVALIAGGVLILASYLVVGKLLKVRELSNLSELVRTRFGRRGGGAPAADSAEVEEEFSAREQLPFEDQLPTLIQPAIVEERPKRGLDDELDPPTVIRNRPAVVTHSFEHAAPAEDLSEEPSVEEPAAEPAEESTGAFDIEALFRPAAPELEPEPPMPRIATVGTLLQTRYELLELLTIRHRTETWRAHDQVLSRDVVVHVMAPGDTRISSVLAAARKGAAATDSRFLRVLDADEVVDPHSPLGAYVVAEYTAGRRLEDLLAQGPLSAIEAAFVARELADALVGVHGMGLFHEQITPDSVMITPVGAVRLVGFGIDAALASEDGTASWSTREEADVVALGNLLYAMLVCHWPDGPAWGLPAAPMVRGETAPAHTVQVGVSPALDRICTAIISRRGASIDQRITSASQLVNALTQILGTADASADLEARVRAWKPVPRAEHPRPTAPRPDLALELAEPSLNNHPRPAAVFSPIPVDEGPTRLDRLAEAASASEVVEADDPAEEAEDPQRRKWWTLLALAIAALVIALIVVGVNTLRENGSDGADGQAPAASATAEESMAAEALPIVSVVDFDPEADGGNAEENPDDVANVIDGDESTTWKTLRYLKRANLGGLKPGVGIIADLGEAHEVSSVDLGLIGGATSVEIRVPKGEEASMKTEGNWQVVGADEKAKGTTTIELDEPVTTQYVLVYFTNLPKIEGGFAAELSELALH